MTKMKMIMLLIMQCMVAWFCSCVKAPVEVTLKNRIEISESQVKEIAEDIYEKLAEIDFEHPPGSPAGMIDKDICSAAYKVWLRKQFDQGIVPKETVLPREYASSSNDPLIHQCRAIDFEKEYEDAVQKSASENKRKRKALIFGISQFRDALNSNRCTDNFIDLDKEKIAIKAIYLNVVVNKLSVKAPIYKLYTSYDDISEEELETPDAEESLKTDGTIMLLGETRAFERRFVGRVPVDLESDRQKFFEAEGPAVSLDGILLAIPTPIANTPETKTVGSKTYYIVPEGKLSVTLSTEVAVHLSTSDAKCAFDRFKESIREEEAKREKEAEAEGK